MGLFTFNIPVNFEGWSFFKKKPKCCLIVEDDAVTSLMISRSAEREGLQAEIATTAEEALGILHRNGRNFVIAAIDVNLPSMDGWELRNKLRDAWPGLRVVVMSGAAESFYEMPRGERLNVFIKTADFGNLFRGL